MNYDELMDLCIELGIRGKNADFKSSELLEKCISNDKTEYYKLFTSEAFTDEVLELLIENSNSEEELLFLIGKDINPNNSIIKRIIDKGYFTIVLDTFKIDEEISKYILDNLDKFNSSYDKLKRITRDISKKDLINIMINKNRIDLLSFILGDELTKEESELLYDYMPIIIKHALFFNRSYNTNTLRHNPELIGYFIKNGCLAPVRNVKYYGYDFLITYLEEHDDILDILVDKADVQDDDMLDCYLRISKLKSNERLLTIMIDKDKASFLYRFDNSAWTLELQKKYLTKKLFNKELYSQNLRLPFESYVCDYSNYSIYNYGEYDPNSNSTFTDSKKSSTVGEKIDDNTILGKFYKLIYETGSYNIHKLCMLLTKNNIENINLIIDENGFTDYFKEYLYIDPDYINYCKKNNIELEGNEAYKLYTEIITLDEKMPVYMKGICFSKELIERYFNDGKIDRLFIDMAFNLVNINSLSIIKEKYELELSEVENLVINTFINIKSNKQKETFLNYCLSRKNELTMDSIERIYELIKKIDSSNSYEIRSKADDVLDKLSKLENFLEEFNELESIFVSGTCPEFIKRYTMYKLLYGDVDLSKDGSITSPILKSVDRVTADKIILNDLLRVSLSTNSRDIEKYFETILKGDSLVDKIMTDNVELSKEEKKLLKSYRTKIEFLASKVLNLKFESVDSDIETIRNIEKVYFSFPFSMHMPGIGNFIVNDSFGSNIYALNTLAGRHLVLKTALEESKKFRNEKLTIKEGDFIKGVDSIYFDNIMEYGSLSKEFLGEASSQDGTHLDTDFSYIPENYEDIPSLLKTSLTGCNWGDTKLILSSDYIKLFNDSIETIGQDGQIEFTEDDYNKTEIFCCNKTSNHYCARTGIPLTYVKAVIASTSFDRIKFSIIKNDFYIPVYDTNGNLILSYEDYYEGRKSLQGLSYYGEERYEISDNLVTDEILAIGKTLVNNESESDYKRNIILKKLKPIFDEYFTTTEDSVGDNVSKGTIEIMDTGSTGRNTNVAGDGDFDFIVRVDRSFLTSDELGEFSRKIYETFNKPTGNSTIIRMDDIKLDELEDSLKVDITLIDKNNKVLYSTEMCIKDRLNNIRNQYPDKYPLVVANIVYGKKFFKDLGIYKPNLGGLGGVGVENLILQHGGSFYDAAVSILECAKEYPTLREFKEHYQIYDFGKNHFAYSDSSYRVRYPYDNYIDKLNDNTFKQIVEALKQYVGEYEKRI